MIGSFYGGRRILHNFSADRLFPKLDVDTLVRGSRIHFVLAALYVLAVSFVPSVQKSFVTFVNVASQLFLYTPLLMVATLAYLARPRRANLVQFSAAAAVVAAGVAATSMLSDALAPLTGLTILWWRARERLPVVPAVLGIAAMLVLQPVKSQYRTIHWMERPNSGVLESWQEAFSNQSADSHSSFGNSTGHMQATFARLDELSSTAYTVEVVPESVPHTGGLVYSTLLVSAIPRVLWPNKPDITKYALDPFAIALGMTDPDIAENSTTGLTLTAQGYLEHGVAGSVAWMALFGVVLAFLSRYFGPKMAGTLGGASVMVPMGIAFTGGFISVFGSLWQLIFGATVLTWLVWCFGRGWARGDPAGAKAA